MKCRVQGYKSWKTGERRKWEKEGQIKGRGKRQSHKTGSLMMVCWAVGYRKHFSPTCWNPVATGDSSKFTQLMPSGSRFALWCPITWKQGNSSHKTLGVHQADPMNVNWAQSFTASQTWDVKRFNQNEVLHNLPFSIKRDYLLEVEQYIILPINWHIYGTIYLLYETSGYWENQRWWLVNLIICFSVAVYACSYGACARGLLLATVQLIKVKDGNCSPVIIIQHCK